QAPPTAPTPPPTITAAPTPPPAPPIENARAPVASLEAEYTGRVRNMLNAAKRYPTSREARQLRPKGTVKVWLEIDRAGQILGAGIEASAGTLLLDNEALRTIRNVQYPAFPAEAFVGQASRRFIVSIEYQPAESS
ncbi:TonB family protein, partial [Roseateles sp. GG27B]